MSMENELQNISSIISSENLTKDESNSSNLDIEEINFIPYNERIETFIVPSLFAIIFILGILGNFTLILICIKHRHMRNIPNMFICSLAVGDLLVIFFVIPFTSTIYSTESWLFGELICKISEFISLLSVGISVFTLTALSADRYFAIVDPMRKIAGRRAARNAFLIITGIWCLSTILALPATFSYIKTFTPTNEYDNETDSSNSSNYTYQICYPFPESFGPSYPKFIVMFKFLVYYAIPLVLIASFYTAMARNLILSTRNIPGEAQQQSQNRSQIQARKKVAKMVITFVIIFALCFFPSHLFFIWFYYFPDAPLHFNAFWHFLRILGFCLAFSNSTVNPIALYFLSATFRKYFNQHLFCYFCHGEGRPKRGGVCGDPSQISGFPYGEAGLQQTRNGKSRNEKGDKNRSYGGPRTSMSNTLNTTIGPQKRIFAFDSPSQHHSPRHKDKVIEIESIPLAQINCNSENESVNEVNNWDGELMVEAC